MAQLFLFPKSLAKRYPVLTKIAWRIEAWALAGVFQLLRWLPMEWAGRLCGFLFRSFGRYGRKYQIALRNLKVIYPQKSAEEIAELGHQTFYSLGLAVAELIHMPRVWEQRQQRLEFAVDEQSEAIIHSKRPVVYVIAHTGAWQFTNMLASEYGFPASIIYAPETNPYMREVFLKLRSAFQTRLVSKDGGMRALTRELKDGNSIGLAIDTRLDGAPMIPLFGIETETNTAPARLALRNQCPMLPVHVERLPNFRYRINVGREITADSESASDAEKSVEMTTKINQIFEQWILQTPGQWICLKRRWPKSVYPPKKKKKNKRPQ